MIEELDNRRHKSKVIPSFPKLVNVHPRTYAMKVAKSSPGKITVEILTFGYRYLCQDSSSCPTKLPTLTNVRRIVDIAVASQSRNLHIAHANPRVVEAVVDGGNRLRDDPPWIKLVE